MLWIGLTGPMGSGKSAVGAVLRQLGYRVLDADDVVRMVLSPGGEAETEVLKAFGQDLRAADGGLDRRALGRVVFADPAKLLQLEAILHPRVRRYVDSEKQQLANAGVKIAFYDVPLLFEKKMEPLFDQIWVVSAPAHLRLERLMKRTGLSREEIEARWANQLPPEYKEARASFVLNNSGSLEDLRAQVARALNSLPSPA